MFQPSSVHHPRLSRETRRLLLAAGLALVVLWLLARVRFTDGPAAPNPVSPLLGQLTPPPALSQLAAEIGRLRSRVAPSVVVLRPALGADGVQPLESPLAALRVADDVAVTVLPRGARRVALENTPVVATDLATGLTLVTVTAQSPAVVPTTWVPQQPEEPRYLLATTVSAGGTSLRPVFVGALDQTTRPAWSGPIWTVPPEADLQPGSFVFTTSGELAGVVIDDGGDPAIVPADTLHAGIARLQAQSTAGGGGVLGFEVQAMTPALAAATGSSGGVMVTWVDPRGPAADALAVGDVIEIAGGEPVATDEHWTVRRSRIAPEQTIALGVRRDGELRTVEIVAAAVAPAATVDALGLVMRAIPAVGSEVVRVERASAGDRAGVAAGDIITLAGDVARPTPARVRAAFAAAREGALLLAITRGSTHRVAVLER